MRKLAVFILALLAVGCTVFGFTACDKDGDEAGYYIVSDFESTEELLTINYFNVFGKVETSEEHVTSGEHSAKMEVHGYDNIEGAGNPAPMFKIYTNSKFNTRADYTRATSFELDIYNDSDRDLELTFQFRSGSFTKGGYSDPQTYTLKAKQDNHVRIEFDRVFLNTFIDISRISEFIFTLPLREVGETDPYVVYVDRFAARLSDIPIDEAQFDTYSSYLVAGETFDVPSISGTEWTISRDGVLDETLKNADSFVAEKGQYEIKYYTEQGGDNVCIAVHTVFADTSDILPMDVSDCYKEQKAAREYPYPDKVENSTDNGLFETGAVRVTGETPAGGAFAFMYDTGLRNELTETGDVAIYLFNASSSAVTFWYNADANSVSLPAGGWTRVSIPNGDFGWYIKNHGSIATGQFVDNVLQLRFVFNATGVSVYDIVVAVKLDVTDTLRPALIPLEEHFGFAEINKEFTVPAVDGASWKISYEGEEKTDLANAAKFTPDQYGTYTIKYSMPMEGETATATYTLYVENPESAVKYDMESVGEVGGGQTTPSVEEITEGLPFGATGIRLYGNGLGYDTGVSVKTGIFNELEGLRLYFYNGGTQDTTAKFHGGVSEMDTVIHVGEWNVFTMSAGDWNWYDQNHGLVGSRMATAYKDESGEWCLRLWLNGGGVFDITVIAFFDKGDPYAPNVVLEEDVYFAEKGDTVTVPEVEDATWTIAFNGTVDESLNNATTFEAKDFGVYTVKYTKSFGDLTGTGTYTVYVENPADLVDGYDLESVGEYGGGQKLATAELVTDNLPYGATGLRLYGTELGYDAGVSIGTGIFNELEGLTFLLRNNRAEEVRVNFNGTGHNGTVVIPAGEWRVFTQDAGLWNWYNTNHGITGEHSATAYKSESGEWYFRLWMKGSNDYDVTFIAFFDRGAAYAPSVVLDETTAFSQLGETVTVPDVPGATWTISYNGSVLDELNNALSFLADEAGVYTVNYSLKAGELTGTGTYTVYAEDAANLVSGYDIDSIGAVEGGQSLASAELVTEGMPFNGTGLRMYGTNLGYDTGVKIGTGIFNELEGLTFYFFNNGTSEVSAKFNGDGNVSVMIPVGGWARFTQDAGTWNWYDQNHGLVGSTMATAFKDVNGEWYFRFWLNGPQNFDVTVVAFFDRGAAYAPTVVLEDTTAFAKTGDTVEIPAVENATWTVSLNGALKEELANQTSFVAEAGVYTVEYSVTVNDLTGKGTYTVYVENSGTVAFDIANVGNYEGMPQPQPSSEIVSMPYNVTGLRIYGTDTGYDRGVTVKTGLTGTLQDLTFYIYNNGVDMNLNFNGTGHEGQTLCASGTWTKFTQTLEIWNFYDTNHGINGEKTATAYRDETGEWCFRFWVNGHGGSGFDLTIVAVMSVAQA